MSTIVEVITQQPTVTVEIISQQALTTVETNSFRSVPLGVNLTASGNGLSYLSNDGTYKTVTVSQTNSDWNSTSGVSQILNKPSLGTASGLNVPASGNAASGEVVKGNDTRLSDARTPLSHNHIIADVTGLQIALDSKFNNPTGDTTQYIAGDGSLVAFPVAGQAGTLVRQVRNETGSTLTKGTIVYISGAAGNKALVSKGLATNDATSAQTFGVVQADISHNNNGYVVVRGDLIGIDTSAFADGTQLYLSGSVAGTFTSVKPVAPIHMVYVGVVTRQHVTQGQIEVAIQNGYELDELHDVLITSKTNKDVIYYDNASGLWKNKQLTTSDVVGLDTSLSGKQPLTTVLTNTTASFTTTLETKLNGIAAGATANSSDATLLSRANHTGTQLASTISDFSTAADARVVAGITGKENTIAAGTIAQYWRGDKSWQTLNSAAVGLGNVNNTSDANKPVSTATQTALNLKYDASNPNGYTTNLGTVTTASVVSANGFAGSVATASTTPAITISTTITGLLKGNGTAISAATAGTDYLTPTGSAASLTGLTSGQVTTALGFTPYNATNPSGYTTNTGTVTTASIVTANGFSGSVANASTTPAITIDLQDANGSQSGKLTSADWTTFNNKQEALVSGTNIKTVNGTSLLGSGDIVISAGSAFSLTEIEVDFGTKPVRSKKFTITNASITGSSKIIVSPSGNVATGRVGDDWEWDSISASAKAGTGQFTLTCFASGKVAGKRKFYYTYS